MAIGCLRTCSLAVSVCDLERGICIPVRLLFARGEADAAICVTLLQVSHQFTQNGIIQKTEFVCNCDSLFKTFLISLLNKFMSSFLKESQHLRLSSNPIPKTSNINL
jgi:hypothetical protein